MNLQEMTSQIITLQRTERMKDSIQLTLGKLIAEIEKCELKISSGHFKTVDFDFGSAIPTRLASWRGSYAELALGYKLSGRDAYDRNNNNSITADILIQNLKEAIGKSFEGWKGGDFIMNEDTPVWVSNPGDSGNTGIIGVYDAKHSLVILTAYCEY